MLRTINTRKLPFSQHFLVNKSKKSTFEGKVLAIRREDASVWERRAALTPRHVKELSQRSVKVLVQPCNRRIYANQTYRDAGAIVQENIKEASVIMGVKEVSLDNLYPDKTYCFFSHVTKAYEPNMPMLDCILRKNIRLIDYEKLVDSKGERLVAFGKYAGIAGTVNILHGLGIRLLSLGYNTPFLHIGLAHSYRHSFQARQSIREAGYDIALGLMPKSVGPLVFVITGTGRVSKGSQEIFEELPYEYVEAKNLNEVFKKGSTDKVYGTIVGTKDYLKRIDGGNFNKEEFRAHPDRYYSIFAKEIAPYASVIINGLHWEPGYPKLLTSADAKCLLTKRPIPKGNTSRFSLPHRLLAICDISSEVRCAFEFMTKCTRIEAPFNIYDADQNEHWLPFCEPGVLMCSIDNMPTQFALEATNHFSEMLFPYVDSIICSDATKPLQNNNFHKAVRGAVIVSNSKLTPEFEYISQLRNSTKISCEARKNFFAVKNFF